MRSPRVERASCIRPWRTSSALHYGDAARVDGRAFASALRDAGRHVGLTVRNADVTGLRLENEAVRGIGDAYDADSVVIAGGAWSDVFESNLGIDVPVAPKRGQIVHLDTSPIDASRPSAEWPIVKAFRHQYQVPWPDDRVVCGATRERGSGFEPHVTLDGLRKVSTETLRIAPRPETALHVETRVGLRPASADGLPLLGPVPGVEGAFLATATARPASRSDRPVARLSPTSSEVLNRPSTGPRSGQIGFETSDMGRTAMSSPSVRRCG